MNREIKKDTPPPTMSEEMEDSMSFIAGMATILEDGERKTQQTIANESPLVSPQDTSSNNQAAEKTE